MKKQPFANFCLAGISITEYGLQIPSPFASLEITNSEITSMTAWTLNCVVGGDSSKKINVSAFEALLYSSAQSANSYPNSSGIPVSFVFGWLDEYGNVSEYTSYQGFTLQFTVSTNGLYMNYKLKGYAALSVQSSMPVLRIPAVSGFVQPSAVVEALAISTKATSYYQLDIDHCDAPTLVNHGALTTSFNKYVRGSFSAEDDYDNFPGLLPLSKSYSSSRDAGGLKYGYKSLSQVLNNASITPVSDFLKQSNTDTTPQCASFSYWVNEPTMTKPGTIHYKSNAALQSSQSLKVLEYGTSNTNILSLQGSYNGIAYNMSNMNFSQIGFTGVGQRFFLSFIYLTSSFIASFAITSICCPTVLMGMIASFEIGELSNPTILYRSGRQPYFLIIIFRRILAWVSLGIKTPLFFRVQFLKKLGYTSIIFLKVASDFCQNKPVIDIIFCTEICEALNPSI